jgi:hypothetical protein
VQGVGASGDVINDKPVVFQVDDFSCPDSYDLGTCLASRTFSGSRFTDR